MIHQIKHTVKQIVQQHARLPTDVAMLTDDSDLYQAGLTSLASVTLMLALEEAFDVEFPERMLRRRTFETIANIIEAITELTKDRSPGTVTTV